MNYRLNTKISYKIHASVGAESSELANKVHAILRDALSAIRGRKR